jgi:hypothetical protein
VGVTFSDGVFGGAGGWLWALHVFIMRFRSVMISKSDAEFGTKYDLEWAHE